MKALLLALLLLSLGAGALFLTLERDGRGREGRGRGGRDAQPEAPAQRTPSETQPRAQLEPSEAPSAAAEPIRRALESGAARAPTASYRGTVIGAGAPIQGARLTLLARDVELSMTRSDERGRFQLDTPPLVEAGVLRVVARGFAPMERQMAPKPAGGTILLGNVRLVHGQRLVGRVLGPGGAGVPDARISAQPPSSGRDVLVAHARSGPDGRFELPAAAPGSLRVSVRAKGLAEKTVQYTKGSGPLEIQLEAGLELLLLVRSPRGPVADAEVSIHSVQANLGNKRVGRTDAEGEVTFEGLAASAWSARVSHPEFRPMGGVRVLADGRQHVVECKPWPAIEGNVRTPGGKAPPAGTLVQALPAAAPGDRARRNAGGVETDAEGRFRLVGLRPGNWRVLALAPGYAPTSSTAIQLGYDRDGHVGTIELIHGATLLVRPTLDGAPMPQAEVELLIGRPTAAQLWAFSNSSLGPRVPCGPDGTATLANIKPGTVWIGIYSEGCPPLASGPHVVRDSPNPVPVEAPMVAGARIRGRVVSAAGAPIDRPRIRIVEQTGQLGFPLTIVGDEGGRYLSSWLPPGSYTIEAFARGAPQARAASGAVRVESGQELTVDLHL